MSVETWNHVLNPAQREHLMVSTVCTVTLSLNGTSLRPLFSVQNRQMFALYRKKITKFSYIGTLSKVWFMQDSS